MSVSVDPTTDRLAHVIEGMVFGGGIEGPTVAALAVLGDYEIAEGLRAARIIAQLRAGHSWRSWGPDSTARSCSCGTAACQIPDALEGAE